MDVAASTMTCWLCGFETSKLLTKAEIPSCKDSSCQICIAVANIDEEINQAVATLQSLIAKRRDLRSEQNRVHDFMRRLPLELRNHIFEMALPKQDQWGQIVERQKSRIVMPSRLASICRNWCDIAWSNPSLWSTIRIKLSTRGPDSSRWIPFVQDWIARSRTLPLTLRIYAGGVSEMVWRSMLDVISPSSNRWQSLSFSCPHNLLCASLESTLHYDHLRRLQIIVRGEIIPSVVYFDTTTSPEEIYISGLCFGELQISCNHLTSATVDSFGLDDVAQLFQHASRMTYCHIETLCSAAEGFSMPPIIHQSLTALRLSGTCYLNLEAVLFGSLTLPHLQEFHTDRMFTLTTGYLPVLVRRSSSPLSNISLGTDFTEFIGDLQPWPGIIDLVLTGGPLTLYSIDPITRLLLEAEYFPDLRYLTLRLEPFLFLWEQGLIRKLLERRGPRPDSPNEGRLHRLLVVEEDRAPEFHDMWNSDVGEQLKAFNVRFREDGFEIF